MLLALRCLLDARVRPFFSFPRVLCVLCVSPKATVVCLYKKFAGNGYIILDNQLLEVDYELMVSFVVGWGESKKGYKYCMRTSQTAMMWQMLPARTKKWNTLCM